MDKRELLCKDEGKELAEMVKEIETITGKSITHVSYYRPAISEKTLDHNHSISISFSERVGDPANIVS